MTNKSSLKLFIELAEKTLVHTEVRLFLTDLTWQEEKAFHRIHERLMAQDVPEKVKSRMHEWYPFLKVNNRWRFSVQRFYMYLFYSRQSLLKTGNYEMEKLHDAVVNATKYTDRVQQYQRSLKPQQFDNWQDYQDKLSEMFSVHLMEQKSIFELIAPTK